MHAREKTPRPVVLRSLLGVLGACTLMGVNMPEVRPPVNSDYREITPKRLVTVSELEMFLFFCFFNIVHGYMRISII